MGAMDIGIDLGTTKVIIYKPGVGELLREPAVVAVNVLEFLLLKRILTLFSKEEAAFRTVNTVSTVSFKRMRTEKAILIFSKKNTAQEAVRTIFQTVRRDTLGTTGKALRLKSTAHL